jgi:hypothetical protein
MADNSVYITGIAEGAISDELEKLPPWATEKTSESIEAILRKSLGIHSKTFAQLLKTATAGGTGLTPEDMKKARTELEKLIKDLESEDPRRKKRNREVDEESKRQKKRWRSEKDNFDSQIFLNSAIIKSGLAIKQAFEDNVKTFDELTAAGVNVISGFAGAKDGFQSLRQLTAETGVRFTELAASMAKYSSSVNSFGVGKFAKTVGMASANLTQFGFSSKESADLLGSYLSVQQNSADVNLKTAAETSEGLQKFGAGIFRLTMATGMSRAAIMANIESISKSTEANLLNGQIGSKAAQGVGAFLSSFKDQNIAKQILKLMTDPIKPLNETFMNLQKVGMGGFAQSFASFAEGLKGMPEEMQAQQMKEYIKAHRGELEAEKQRLNMLKQAGVEGAGASLDFIVGLTQQADAIKPLKEEEVQRLMASNKASKDLATAWENLKSLLQRAFGPTATMLNALTTVLKLIIAPLEFIIWGFNKLSDGLSAVLKVFGVADGIDLTAWIGIGVIGIALYKSLDLFGTALTAITSAMKAKAFGGAGKKGTTHVTESLADRAGGKSSKGSNLMGKIGKGIGDIGKGLGKGVKGFLIGLADGLKALGNPKVLLGVSALAGIAAALWITGKAVAEFTKVSWEDLAKAGVAIVGLTLAVMGLGAIMSTGVGTVAILAGAAALAVMGASLWLLGAGIQSIGSGFEMLGKGLDSLKNVSGMQILGITAALIGLGVGLSIAAPALIIGSIGLLALGAASLVAGPGIALLAQGLKGLSEISGLQIAGIALGISSLAAALILATPLLIMAAPGLIVFGAAALVAAIPIKMLAWGLKSLTDIKANDLLGVAASLTMFGVALGLAAPLLVVSSVGLTALGVAALIASPGLMMLSSSLEKLSAIGVAGLLGMAVGLTGLSIALALATPFLIAGSVGLIAIGVAALIATPGLLGVSLAFKIMSEAISNLATVGFVGLVGVGAGIAALAVTLAIALPFMLIASAGLLALGTAALIATPGIIGVGYGLKLIGEGMQAFAGIGFTDMLKVAGGLIALGAAAGLASIGLLIGAPGLLAFGIAALVAGPGIKLLAEGLALLEPLKGANLASLAKGIDALTAAGKIKLMAFGLSALVAAPGIKALAEGLAILNEIDGFNLFTVAMGINELSSVSVIGLLGLGYVGDKAGEGIKLLAAGLVPLGKIDGVALILNAIGINLLSNINAIRLMAFGLAASISAPGIIELATGLVPLSKVDGVALIINAIGIDSLSNINAIKLMAFGLAAGIAGPGIAELAAGLVPLSKLNGIALIVNSVGINSLSNINAMKLLAFGLAAGIAGPGISILAEGLVPIGELDGESLLGVAPGIEALADISAIALLAFGLAAGIAGPGIAELAAGLVPIGELDGESLLGVVPGIDALSNINAIKLLAFGLAAGTAAPGIIELAAGLVPLGELDASSLLSIAPGIKALTDISAMALLAFGLAAGIAAPGIAELAAGLVPLGELDASSLLSIAPGIKALTDISAVALLAFGVTAGIAAPGIAELAAGLVPLGELDGESLTDVALGITALTDISAMALLAFGLAAGIAGSGIQILSSVLSVLAPGLESSANAFISLSTGLDTLSGSLGAFTGLDTLKSIVETINGIDIVKALAFGALAKIGSVSLPAPTSTAGVSTPNTPKASELNSPSQVSTAEGSKGEQATPKESIQANGAGIEKTSADTGINTALGYQSSLLEQLLLSTNNLVSVNKDILKYARVQA